MKQVAFYQTAVGEIGIAETQGQITNVYFGAFPLPDGMVCGETPLLKDAASQLFEYFSGARKSFSLPLAPSGTPFQQRVFQNLLTIGYGQTRTYGEIARQCGNAKACRAVGMANHNNPIPIFIPCHRVIGQNGKLTGYAGGLAIKQFLLTLEAENK